MEGLKVTAALLVALFQKPHDRLFVINLENDILEFVGSSAYTYQLKPMNSYYRLLSHQVAEYHGLQHTVSKDDDKCVIVYKQNNFQPNQKLILLQHLDPQLIYQFPPEYFAMASMAAVNRNRHVISNNMQYHSRTKSNLPPQDSGNEMQERKKVVILKRNSYNKSQDELQADQNKCSLSPQQHSVEPSSLTADLHEQRRLKEEQYKQEKDRIFSSSSPSTSISTPPTTPIQNKNMSETISDDSPQPHQFETSRFKFNKQNEIRQYGKPKFHGYNRKGFNGNGNHAKKVSYASFPAHTYFFMQSHVPHINTGPVPYGYPTIPPMDYMYYPMSVSTIGQPQMMVSSQPIYPIPSTNHAPYDESAQLYKENGSTDPLSKKSANSNNGNMNDRDAYATEVAKVTEKLKKTELS